MDLGAAVSVLSVVTMSLGILTAIVPTMSKLNVLISDLEGKRGRPGLFERQQLLEDKLTQYMRVTDINLAKILANLERLNECLEKPPSA